jgi:anion-transporting  ArsA/GET3 family ATPase
VQIDEFLSPRIHIVSGKGGVGKTTVAAALALVAARHGRKVSVAEVDRKGSLAHLFGAAGMDLGYEPAELSPGVWGLGIVPEDALAEYLEVQYHMRRISRVFTSSHFVDYITTAAPGLKDILVLGKIWYLENGRGTKHDFDTIVVDAPAAGHMLTFLSAPVGLSDAVRVGPVRRQSDWLVQMLQDPNRTNVHLVSTPEEMPVSETLETAAALKERIGITSGLAFANAVYTKQFTEAERTRAEQLLGDDLPELMTAAKEVGLEMDAEDLDALRGYERFLAGRREIQKKHLRTLRRNLDAPLIELPFLFSAGLELPDIENLADAMEQDVARL